ncbi:MAG: Do family serine endopeptidase [Verrucomicrobiota bacterium]|jgi:serine protease Do
MKKTIAIICSKARLGLMGALLVAVAASAATGWMKDIKGSGDRPKATLNINDKPLERDGRMSVSFAPVIQEISPSVVTISTTTEVKTRNGWDNNGWEQFFGRNFPGFRFPEMPESESRSGLGSGVVVSPEGYILTNNHVIEGSDEIKVILSPDNEEHIAEVVGVDPKSDVAVLKIDADGLQPIELGDSDQILVGDIVLALGNPFGVGQTVTMGMVSAKGRAHMGLDYEDFIQTDAAINPGNSGGALVDAQGRLVGINTAILSRSGGNLGIGFAIPINLARSVMESLIDHGQVVRGFLGVNIQDVNPTMARYFDLDSNAGAVIADVVADSPAEASGLKAGDVVVKFDGKTVKDSRHLKLLVGQSVPEKDYSVEVVRGGKIKELDVALGTLDSDTPKWASRSSKYSNQEWPNDMRLSELNPELRREYDIPGRVDGLLVTGVKQGSEAWNAGIRPGAVIEEVNRVTVESFKDLGKVDFAGDEVLVRVWMEGNYVYRVLKDGSMG